MGPAIPKGIWVAPIRFSIFLFLTWSSEKVKLEILSKLTLSCDSKNFRRSWAFLKSLRLFWVFISNLAASYSNKNVL
jgi:hypothetical protein